MKKNIIKHNCVICGAEFSETKKTHIKTCEKHRNMKTSGLNIKIKSSVLKDFNDSLQIIKIANSGGYLGISTKFQNKTISRNLLDMQDKEIYLEFLKELKNKIDLDIEKLNNTDYKLFNCNNFYSLETYNKLK